MNIMPGFGIAMGGMGVALDAATAAWVAEVVSNGGTVSDARAALVDELIVGLKADGIWSKLDRLWLFAAEDQPSALTDLVGLALGTATGSPTFTVDEGYTGASGKYLTMGISPVGGANYGTNSAMWGVWSLKAASDTGVIVDVEAEKFYPRYVDNIVYWRVLMAGDATEACTDGSGFWCASRTGNTTSVLYRNGSSFDTSSSANQDYSPSGLWFFANSAGSEPWTGQVACGVLGGGLNSTEAGNLYSRLQTYMTAVMSEAATAAWEAEATSNGGTVSSGRRALVKELIAGLMDDGIWHKLDRLWLFAAEDEESALTDLVGLTLATAVNSPTFTADGGFTGNGSNMNIDTNFQPQAGGVNFTQNDCSWMAWNNTGGTDNAALFSTETNEVSRLFPEFGDGFCYWDVNNQSIDTTNRFANSSPIGSYIGVRTASNASVIYKDGTSAATSNFVSFALQTETFRALQAAAGANFSVRQIAAIGFGGSLTSGEASDFHTHLSTYMAGL